MRKVIHCSLTDTWTDDGLNSGAEILVNEQLCTLIFTEELLNSGAELERISAFIHGYHSSARANSGAEILVNAQLITFI